MAGLPGCTDPLLHADSHALQKKTPAIPAILIKGNLRGIYFSHFCCSHFM
jgi:hypothetical protein